MKERVGEYACKWCRKKKPAVQGYPYVCQWQARGKTSQRVWGGVCCVVCSPEHAEAQGGGEVCLWKVVRGRKGTGGWEAVCLSVILYLSQGKALGSVTMSERVSVHVWPSMWGGGDTQEP